MGANNSKNSSGKKKEIYIPLLSSGEGGKSTLFMHMDHKKILDEIRFLIHESNQYSKRIALLKQSASNLPIYKSFNLQEKNIISQILNETNWLDQTISCLGVQIYEQ